MFDWIIKEHPDFFKDLDKLGIRELQNFYDKKQKIKQNPSSDIDILIIGKKADNDYDIKRKKHLI